MKIKPFLQENASFFLPFALLWVMGFVVWQVNEKGDWVVFFSRHRTPFWNLFFMNLTKLGEGILYIIFGLYFLLIRVRYALLIGIIGGSVALWSNLLKQYFHHPRPVPYFRLTGKMEALQMIDGVFLLEGWNSFPSGHTFSGFAVCGFLAFLARFKSLKISLLTLAVGIGISRIYLAQHFLEDVLFGAMLGVVLSAVLFYLQSHYLPYRPEKWYDAPLFRLR